MKQYRLKKRINGSYTLQMKCWVFWLDIIDGYDMSAGGALNTSINNDSTSEMQQLKLYAKFRPTMPESDTK